MDRHIRLWIERACAFVAFGAFIALLARHWSAFGWTDLWLALAFCVWVSGGIAATEVWPRDRYPIRGSVAAVLLSLGGYSLAGMLIAQRWAELGWVDLCLGMAIFAAGATLLTTILVMARQCRRKT